MIAYLGTLKPPSTPPVPVAPYDLDYLVIAGGGAGSPCAPGNWEQVGAGGAGGYLNGTLANQTTSVYTMYVGAGGPSSLKGSSSYLKSYNNFILSDGGGGGGNRIAQPDSLKNGGSGAGVVNNFPIGTGIVGQGFDGANGLLVWQAGGYAVGGGGGAGSPGAPGHTTAAGGDGLAWLDGIMRGGGGGGNRWGVAGYTAISGAGGAGGGGRGASAFIVPQITAENGQVNTGGGGGTSDSDWPVAAAGAGGSGIVKVRYAGTPRATGGTITQSGGYTYHEFTTSGRLIFTS